MFRAFQTTLDSNGAGYVRVGPGMTNVEWNVRQVSVRCAQAHPQCQVIMYHNGFFVCGSPQGWLDTATGPPNLVVRPGDELTVQWTFGIPEDLATAGVWYTENPVGTTVEI